MPKSTPDVFYQSAASLAIPLILMYDFIGK